MLAKTTFTVREAAAYIGVGLNKLYELCNCSNSNFPAIRVSERKIIILKSALDSWLEQQLSEKK